jgi:mannose-1-phosphate guanylyltransferase
MQSTNPCRDNGVCPEREAKFSRKDPVSCALVLAGGEGKRLRPFIHLLRRDLLPKQYVNFIGRRSMLEHTIDRAEKLVSSRNVFTIINKSHLVFADVRRQIAKRNPQTVIVQPQNRETAPGILFALLHIAKRHPNSIVTILPSDHFVLEENELLRQLKLAGRWVKRDPSRVALIGVEPDREDESEYGYIVPRRGPQHTGEAFCEISSFVEKPDSSTAQQLARDGALWNTMIMVAKTDVLLALVRRLLPELFDAFLRVYNAIGTAEQEKVAEQVYEKLPPVNFSKAILEPAARGPLSKIVTFPVRNVLWSDWGSECRIMEVLRKTGNGGRLNGLSRAPETREAARQHDPFVVPSERPSFAVHAPRGRGAP